MKIVFHNFLDVKKVVLLMNDQTIFFYIFILSHLIVQTPNTILGCNLMGVTICFYFFDIIHGCNHQITARSTLH